MSLHTPRLLLVASFALSAACTSSWEGEAESPRPAWEDENPPGASTVAAPPQAQAAPSQTASVQDEMNADVEETDPTAVATFQPVLQPYGAWVDDPVYGYVWVPDAAVVGPGFQPYVTAGHWAYTDYGYYWASDYEWGWATFHYGRWVWVDGRGWVWIPGARWSPAWVEWRYGAGYIGWGPAYPHYCWHGGSAVWITVGPTPYVFAPSHAFFDPHPSHVIVAPSAAPGLVAGTKPYAPPPVVGQKPFVGPDPKAAGIPEKHLSTAKIQPPHHDFAWAAAAGSKVGGTPNPKYAGPAGGKAAVPQTSAPSGVKPMGPGPGKSTSLGTTPSYDAPAATAPKWNGAPTYKPPTYGGSPSYGSAPTYKPPTTTAPTYKPPTYGGSPSYGGGSPAYKPPAYSPPSTTYHPPAYSPPSTTYHPPTYSPPPTYHPPSTSTPTYHPPTSTYHPPSYSAPVSKPQTSHPSFGGGKKK